MIVDDSWNTLSFDRQLSFTIIDYLNHELQQGAHFWGVDVIAIALSKNLIASNIFTNSYSVTSVIVFYDHFYLPVYMRKFAWILVAFP